MKISQKWVVVSVTVLALVAGTALGYAQAQRGPDAVLSTVLSGSDIGFRVEGRKGTAVVGRFVVRIAGKWVDVESSFVSKPLTEVR